MCGVGGMVAFATGVAQACGMRLNGGEDTAAWTMKIYNAMVTSMYTEDVTALVA